MSINIFDPTRNYYKNQEEFDSIIGKILKDGKYINGPEVSQIEEELCKYTSSKYCIGVSSGTDALLLALMALDIKAGDEVITTPFTWISTSEVISLLGAVPVFVDINPETYNLNISKIKEKITPKTKVILPVSIFGKMIEIDELMKLAEENNLFVIEDAAQSMGSRYKEFKSCSVAHISCTSFYPTKSLGCFGDGGACFTNDEKLYLKIKALKDHGCLKRHEHNYIGINGRLDTIQAGILLVKLKYLNSDLEKRRSHAEKYNERFKLSKNIKIPYVSEHDYHIYAQYTIKLNDNKQRESLLNELKKNNINVSVFYPIPLHLQKCFSYLNYKLGDFPVSENIGDCVISLPVYPELTGEELNKIINVILEWDKH